MGRTPWEAVLCLPLPNAQNVAESFFFQPGSLSSEMRHPRHTSTSSRTQTVRGPVWETAGHYSARCYLPLKRTCSGERGL